MYGISGPANHIEADVHVDGLIRQSDSLKLLGFIAK
jgi:hypothetical protein